MNNIDKGGWAYPARARKGHYFCPGSLISVCGRWLFGGTRFPADEIDALESCVVCARKVD